MISLKMFVSVFIFAAIVYGANSVHPECGTIAPVGQQLKRSTDARPGEAPWHAAIYKKDKVYRQLCGATLISSSVVLTAAHCVWSNEKNAVEPASKFAVAAGKLHRSWDDPIDQYAQKADVATINVPLRFHGAVTNYQDDIAVVKLASALDINNFVRPACLDFNHELEERQFNGELLGKIASWSVIDSASGIEKQRDLRVQEVPYVKVDQCFRDAPFAFREFVTSDKFCAYSTDPSNVLCRGGSGGGLAFPTTDTGVIRYYMRGIASVSPTVENQACSHLVLYTQVSKHEHFIKKYL